VPRYWPNYRHAIYLVGQIQNSKKIKSRHRIKLLSSQFQNKISPHSTQQTKKNTPHLTLG